MGTLLRKIRHSKIRPAGQQIRQHYKRAATACAALFITWVIAGIWILVLPSSDSPQSADVLFVLGPPDNERMNYAQELMRRGDIGALAVSSPVDRAGNFTAPVCETVEAYPITCFHPEPFTTQGEARALEVMSKEHGWQNANVLTAQHHVTRARIIVERCYKDDFRMIKLDAKVPLTTWPYLFVYHTAAFVKVALIAGC